MNEKYVIIAPWGNHMDLLYPGVREFATEKIVLVVPEKHRNDALKFRQELAKFQIPVEMKMIKGEVWEETFQAIAEIKEAEKDKNILVNVATGDANSRCAATSAAFVNGLRAFAVDGSDTMLLPVLKFSYYRILSDRKMEILKFLQGKDSGVWLEELCKHAKMSLPLVSYHMNGNLKAEGLKSLGLVESTEEKGRMKIKLTMLGRLLVRGYIR